MSSILKALQKLEEDKKKELRRKKGDLPLNQAILTEIQPSTDQLQKKEGQGGRRLVVAAVVSALAAGGAATWINHSLKLENTATPQAKNAEAPALNLQPLQGPAPKVVVIEPARNLADKPPSLPAPKTSTSGKDKKVTISKPVALVKQPQIHPANGPSATAVAPQQSSPKRPVLSVLGIAYHDAGTNSVAIVNGSPVAVGSTVDGAKVEEIQKDRVRFSYNNERFEVQLAK